MRSKAGGGGRRRWLGRFLLFLLLAGIAGYLTSSFWLPQIGLFLVNNQEPLRADAILVLAGDDRGDRLLRAAELSRSGFGPVVYISGSGGLFGQDYSELARQYGIAKGYPAGMFRNFQHDADSTREEAALALERLRTDGVKRLNVVTSDYHSARTRRVFARLAGDMEFRVVASRSWNFQYDNWWQLRRSQKMVLLEYTKTLADVFGI